MSRIADDSETVVLDRPRVHLIRMMVFTILAAILATVLLPQIDRAFQANPGLNGTIIFVLLLGTVYSFRQVWRLFPEINWVNNFRIADPGLDIPYAPRLLAPMATLLRDRQGRTVLSPLSMRSLLDSLAARLDEARDISRYLIGLLVFLGLLGTFWGLLETISSVGIAIQRLDVTTAESSTIFEELKSGLEAPLAGMGTAFSSSLFGLAGSLILGFLDLQANQAQNRFYNDLEDWLSSITDIAASDANSGSGVPHYLRLDLSHLQQGIERMNDTLEAALSEPGRPRPAPPPVQPNMAEGHEDASINRLADAVGGLVHQMREEQKVVRRWAQEQSEQQSEIHDILATITGQPANEPPPPAEPDEGPRRPTWRAPHKDV